MTGTLVILDLAMLRSVWDKPGVKKRLLEAARKRAAEREAARVEAEQAAIPSPENQSEGSNLNRQQRRRQEAEARKKQGVKELENPAEVEDT